MFFFLVPSKDLKLYKAKIITLHCWISKIYIDIIYLTIIAQRKESEGNHCEANYIPLQLYKFEVYCDKFRCML